jgi:hypothetical protein
MEERRKRGREYSRHEGWKRGREYRGAISESSRVKGRVGNFRQKNYSAEDGIDGTIGLFQLNSGCSTEQKTLGIPFRTVPRGGKCREFFTMEQK